MNRPDPQFYERLSTPGTKLYNAAHDYYQNLARFFVEAHADGKIFNSERLVEMLYNDVDPAQIFDINGNSLVKDGPIKALEPVFTAYSAQMAMVENNPELVTRLTRRAIPMTSETAVHAAGFADRMRKVGEQAFENMTTGSTANKILRGAGVGLGAAYTFGGVAKLLTPKRQEVTPEGETIEKPAPSRAKALLQIAAGTGVAAASMFLKTKTPGISA